MDKTKQLFDTRILQQLEHFVRKNNLSTQVQAIYQIHTAFQNQSEILLNKAIDTITSNQLGKITNAQFEELQTQIAQKTKEKLTWNADQAWETDNDLNKPSTWKKGKKREEENITKEAINTKEINSGWTNSYSVYKPLPQLLYIPLKYKDYNELCFTCSKQLLDKKIWNNILGQKGTCNALYQYTILINNWVSYGMSITAAWHQAINCLDKYPHDKDKIWHMTNAKIKRVTLSKILEIKNNPPEPVDIVLIPNPEAFLNIKTGSEKFYEHYQNLAPTREEQEQCLKQLNTRLCQHCLIPYNFQYCNECDLIYNLSICMIYTIPEEEEPISSCVSESELNFNPNSNFDNNDNKNNSFSFVPYNNNNNNNLDSDSNSDLNPKTFITLSDLIKEQELK
ncbi:hypothetical protein G9A89_012494 [Geosiphon pyriformis]|nr:hypothetical protein G9A89_012494 [Geosiphon pyriformis]